MSSEKHEASEPACVELNDVAENFGGEAVDGHAGVPKTSMSDDLLLNLAFEAFREALQGIEGWFCGY